jgi:hypothetical protein
MPLVQAGHRHGTPDRIHHAAVPARGEDDQATPLHMAAGGVLVIELVGNHLGRAPLLRARVREAADAIG